MIRRYVDLSKDIAAKKSLFLFGPRGVGKTNLVKELLSKHPSTLYFNLLQRTTRQSLEEDTGLFRSQVLAALSPKNLLVTVVDEVQLIPQLLDEVHDLIETYKGKMTFILTGSSARKLKRSRANLLAGRALTRELHPLSTIETELELTRALSIGTLPGIYLDSNAEESLDAYVDTYLKEEIQQEAVTRNLPAFNRFLELAGQMNGQTINFSRISRTLNIHHSSVQQWFAILEDTLLVARLSGWDRSIKKQLVQAPKFYFFDCGVLRTITRELGTKVTHGNFRYGDLFENFLVQEIIRYNKYQSLRFAINHWRTSTGQEVDVILSRSLRESPIAVEIKSSVNPGIDDVKGLFAFQDEEPKAKLYCFCRAEKAYKKEGIHFMPWLKGLQHLSEI
jgi:predicted AAA+ superfamily ATPase